MPPAGGVGVFVWWLWYDVKLYFFYDLVVVMVLLGFGLVVW
jgi:hypothetical protein